MPLYWTIDIEERLFTGVGDGEVTLDDAMSLLEALAGAGALPYRKLFDGRSVRSAMTGDEVLALCAAIRTYHDQGPVGALAIVTPCDECKTFARLLGALAAAERPIKLFTSPRQARIWLEQQTSERHRTPRGRKKPSRSQLPSNLLSDPRADGS